jgi:hypothetical protein
MGMTYPGDVITVRAFVKEKKEIDEGLIVLCETLAEDQNGKTKVSGEFEVLTSFHP